MTGERYVVWCGDHQVGPAVSRAVVTEIEQLGVLTEKRRELSQSNRVREILKKLEAA